MKKKIFFLLFACLTLCYSISYAEQRALEKLYCTTELKGILNKIRKLPEVDELLLKVLKKGPISIKINRDFPKNFDGYWSSQNRTIYLTKNRDSSECFLITALIFELHNALRDSSLEHVYSLAIKREIQRDEFIEATEYIEYQNACDTSILLGKGAHSAIFPKGCYWEISEDFQEHLAFQKEAGHSAWIGKIYDQHAL